MCAGLQAQPFRSGVYNAIGNLLSMAETTITIIGIFVIARDLGNTIDDTVSVAQVSRQLGNSLEVAGFLTLSVAFAAILWGIGLDATLQEKQRQLRRLRHRARTLGATFSPDVFKFDYDGWLLPEWLLSATDEELKLARYVTTYNSRNDM